MESKLIPYIHDTWVASKYLLNTIGFQLQPRQLMKASASWNVTSWEPFEASHGQWRRDGSLADVEFLSACIVTVTIHGRRSIYFYPHISCPLLHNSVSFKLTVLWSLSNYHFGPREAGKSLINSSSRDAFNAQNTCHPFVGLVPDEGVASPSMHFSFLYI